MYPEFHEFHKPKAAKITREIIKKLQSWYPKHYQKDFQTAISLFWERKLGYGIVQNSCQLAEWWIV